MFSFITAIPIGFEQERYTVFEEFNATGELIPIPIIKGNNLQSELRFDVIAQFIDGTATRLIDVTGGDYQTIEGLSFHFCLMTSLYKFNFCYSKTDFLNLMKILPLS